VANGGHWCLLVLWGCHGLACGNNFDLAGHPLGSWVLNAPVYRQLAPLGKTVGVPFLVLSAALVAAGVAWFGHRLWGWRLAVVIIATQVLGDLITIFWGHFVRGATGVAIASALLFYLLRPRVRGTFVARRAIER